MSYLYVTQDKSKISCRDNECIINYGDNEQCVIPIETLDGIDIFGATQLTTQAIQRFLLKGIPVSFYAKSGKYYGKLISTGHVNAKRQRKQSALGLNIDQYLVLDKKIISAKANNQLVILRRYSRNKEEDISSEVKGIKALMYKIDKCKNIKQLMGYEGSIAKNYFKALSKLIDENFKFNGRSRRPPKDEFNSLISYGYTILFNEIYGKIEKHGLNPYFGFLHRDDENHPTLCSDLLEEWRPVIIDSLVNYGTPNIIELISKKDYLGNILELLKNSSNSSIIVQKKIIFLTQKWAKQFENCYDSNYSGFLDIYNSLIEYGLSLVNKLKYKNFISKN